MVRRFLASTALLVSGVDLATGDYVVGQTNSNECPAPSSVVTGETECASAATAVGGSFQSADTWTDYPGGCYGNPLDGKVWLNINNGTSHSGYAKVCRKDSSYMVKGPYEVKRMRYTRVDGMDKTDRAIDVWYPVGVERQKFPLIAYAHGLAGGGATLPYAYMDHLNSLAAFGYIVAASEACSLGCSDDNTLPGDPVGWGNYYKQQLLVIDWAKRLAAGGDDVMAAMNLDIGVGIAGHSMGGQSTLYSSSEYGNVTEHGIKAAVIQHAFTHSYPAPTVPFLAFTGTTDDTASADMTRSFYNNASAYPIKGIVNKVGQGHLEPDPGSDFNPALASLTAAWFKLYLDETPQADDNDYHDLIFSKMCDGKYDGAVEDCEVRDPTHPQLV